MFRVRVGNNRVSRSSGQDGFSFKTSTLTFEGGSVDLESCQMLIMWQQAGVHAASFKNSEAAFAHEFEFRAGERTILDMGMRLYMYQ